ncbi:hypothetical protein [Chryseolinea lacunae]|uniref:Ankyrin repeat domain-containing protein n=1 Tax=Chryseolinea lacunae TaxID=2801331 RepID=A0ABS1KNE3_9BACT|nr:hypothetical protein [Chryseolinea lacunae]MBL0741003.1 hypothetical protein [Chryseolinea lacunae]
MITKLVWILAGLNTLALLIFTISFLGSTSGRNVDSMEKGWMTILIVLGVVVILLGVLPIRFSQSTFSVSVSVFFSALPLVVGVWVLLANKLPSLKKEKTMAELYYDDKTQQSIAAAIEQNDTVRLRELIKGQDLNIQGNRVWDWDGLNYLQFAIRLRGNTNFPVNEAANLAAIRILIEAGSATTPALSEGMKRLPPEAVLQLLKAGADPNTRGFVNPGPLVFETVGASKEEIDMTFLLVRNGADVNRKNDSDQTLLMVAALNAGTSARWNDTWRLVRYLLEEAHADYTHTLADGRNFGSIIRTIRTNAATENVTMSPDFDAVVQWLDKHQVDTTPLPEAVAS